MIETLFAFFSHSNCCFCSIELSLSLSPSLPPSLPPSLSPSLPPYLVPRPNSVPIFVPQIFVSKYYSGTEMNYVCRYIYDEILTLPDVFMAVNWFVDGQVIAEDDRISLQTTPKSIQGSTSYFATMTFEYITQADSRTYNCELFVFSNTSDFITNVTSTSSGLTATILRTFIHTCNTCTCSLASYKNFESELC